ncbi:hypothetical protein [Leucobacter sp. M11]|uniref:hypothetical protein n=1 Tax=Leucobacter sp. M11 TaxID=2993565 RepID=UPI002D7E3C62|nr:hypothetical protein [Leucobacter sp. M11]MEB4616643.1 hypothetical protein [Leucobacter sp. M11]
MRHESSPAAVPEALGNPAEDSAPARTGRKRLVLAGGAILLVAVLATAAAFTDFARLNLGTGAEGSGVGNPDRFDIAVVLPDQTVEQADSAAGYDWAVPGAELLVPGGSVQTTIPVFNNTPSTVADLDVSIELLNEDGSVTDRPNITRFLRFTAEVAGAELFRDAPWDEATGTISALAARGDQPLQQGDAFVPGAAESLRDLVLTVTYLDEPETVDYNGGQSAFRVHFAASSVPAP